MGPLVKFVLQANSLKALLAAPHALLELLVGAVPVYCALPQSSHRQINISVKYVQQLQVRVLLAQTGFYVALAQREKRPIMSTLSVQLVLQDFTVLKVHCLVLSVILALSPMLFCSDTERHIVCLALLELPRLEENVTRVHRK